MSLSEEFYDYADEHFGWAETARTERERAIFCKWPRRGWKSLSSGKAVALPRKNRECGSY
jgi:hypothetical protein